LTCCHTVAAPTRPSSERDPFHHRIQTPAPILPSCSLAQHCVVPLAAVVLSNMVVLKTQSSARAGNLMGSFVRLG
jgi:hypothetical protein